MAELSLADSPRDEKLRRWFAPWLAGLTTECAANVDTSIAFLAGGDWEIPLSINDAQWENAWICSPWTHYISYAREEILRHRSDSAGRLTAGVLHQLGKWLQRAAINRVVMVNNWMLSTVPWPALPRSDVRKIIRALLDSWPTHTLIFRSLNPRESGPLIEELAGLGARLIPSRQVWWFAPDSRAVGKSRDLRRDLNLLHGGDLKIVSGADLKEADISPLLELYQQLYIRKYSRHNPDYSLRWLTHVWKEGLLNLTALRDDAGRFVAMEGSVEINGVLTSPMIGYDIEQPRELGLYRRVAAVPIQEARRRRIPLNLSAGVGNFKGLRGGEPVMEYLAVFDRHQPRAQQRPWALIQWLSENFLAPYVRKRRL